MIEPRTFEEVLALSEPELAQCDIALVNLLCATGLPGSENLDIAACLAKVDLWTEDVRRQTEINLRTFKRKKPSDTPALFKCWTLCKVLRYWKGLKHFQEPENADPTKSWRGELPPGADLEAVFRCSAPLFIHGLLDDRRLGSCVSFPPLYAAVGLRLGYPIRLVSVVSHCYIRWEEPGEGFNMDPGPNYLNSHPHDHYIDQPRPWLGSEKTCTSYMRSLAPFEELAIFVGMRGCCLLDNRQFEEAMKMFDIAGRLCPADPVHIKTCREAQRRERREWMKADGWGFPAESESDLGVISSAVAIASPVIA